MIGKMTLAAGLLALGMLAAPQIGAAATFSPVPGVTGSDSNLVQNVQWRGCGFWRRECARRWGWGGWRFRRCVVARGC